MPTLAEYYVSLTIEAEDIQGVMTRVYGFVDKHGEGRPDGVTHISIRENK